MCPRLVDERGFTIMELLVVMTIIGLLTVIAAPAYRSMSTKVRAAACEASRRILDSATGVYFGDRAVYPTAVGDLTPYLDNAADIKCPTGGIYSLDATTHKWTCSEH